MILGIDSEGVIVDSDGDGLLDEGEERCSNPEEAPAWQIRTNLTDVLRGAIPEEHILWYSYRSGNEA